MTHLEDVSFGPSARFMGATSSLEGADFAIFGVPYDSTASYRSGSRFAPDAIRSASHALESYSPVLDRDLEQLNYVDVGDVEVGLGRPEPTLERVERVVGQLLAAGSRPVMLGGEHSLTPAAFRAVHAAHPDVTLLQIDAHADLRESFLGETNSHACAMRRCLDLEVDLIQFGIRSGTREEWAYVRANDTFYDFERLSRRLDELTGPLYVTVDIDVFDPGFVSGTGTPEPGGIAWQDFARITEALKASRAELVGFDVVELAPGLDASGASSVYAAKVVRELLLAG